MSEPAEAQGTPEDKTGSGLAQLRAFRNHAARPELLLPATSLSLGFALILVQPHPLPHPVLAYGLVLCVTTALYLYGREISRIVDDSVQREEQAQSDVLPLSQPLPPSQHGSAINSGSLEALEKSLGLATLLEIVRTYLMHAEELIGALAKLAGEEQWPDAVRIAQDIAGAASGLGLSAVTLAARSFAQKARDGADAHDLRNTAQLIMGEHLRVRRALAQLYPDLAA